MANGCIEKDTSRHEVAASMMTFGIDRLIVVDEDQRIDGSVASMNVPWLVAESEGG